MHYLIPIVGDKLKKDLFKKMNKNDLIIYEYIQYKHN